MQNYKQSGKTMDFTAPTGGVVSGTAYLIGALLVVAQADAAEDEAFAGVTDGVFTLPKTAGSAWTEGQQLYWDTATDSFTTAHSATARRCGCAAADADAGDTEGDVRLNGAPSVVGAETDTVANSAISPAGSVGGLPILIPIDIPDAATATYSYKTAQKIEIIDAWVIKDGAGAANTVQVTDGADAAITNAMAAAVDKTVTHAGTIDKAKRVLASGATFKVVATRAAGTMAAQLFILAIPRA